MSTRQNNSQVLTSGKSIWSIDCRASPPSVVPASKNLQDSVVDLHSDLDFSDRCPRCFLHAQAFIMAAEQRKLLEQLMGGTLARYSPVLASTSTITLNNLQLDELS